MLLVTKPQLKEMPGATHALLLKTEKWKKTPHLQPLQRLSFYRANVFANQVSVISHYYPPLTSSVVPAQMV
jgi:single-stranded DNA-binding protein